jgi:hypothetical protein
MEEEGENVGVLVGGMRRERHHTWSNIAWQHVPMKALDYLLATHKFGMVWVILRNLASSTERQLILRIAPHTRRVVG